MKPIRVCKHFRRITSEDKQMIFGCYCDKLEKAIYYYDCKDCKLCEVENV